LINNRTRQQHNTNRPYLILGWGFCLTGIILAPVFFILLESVPLTGIAFSLVIIGTASISVSYTRTSISQEMCQMMLDSGQLNVSVLIEELGLNNQAIYLPSRMRDGNAQCIIPIKPLTSATELTRKVSNRLIVRYGDAPDDMAVRVAATGSTVISNLADMAGGPVIDIEDTANRVICGYLDLADNVSVNVQQPRIFVAVKNPQITEDASVYGRYFGNSIASIVATISSEALGQPVTVQKETYINGIQQITLQVIT